MSEEIHAQKVEVVKDLSNTEIEKQELRRSIFPTDIQQSLKPLDEDLYDQIIKSPMWKEIRKARKQKELNQDEINVLMAAIVSAQKREQALTSLINRSFANLILSFKETAVNAIREPIFHRKKTIGNKTDDNKPATPGFIGKLNQAISLQNILAAVLLGLIGFSSYQKVKEDALNQSLNALKGSVASIKNENTELKNVILKKEDELKQRQLEIFEATSELSKNKLTLSSEISSLKNNITRLETALEERQKTIETLKKTGEDGIAALHSTNQNLQNNLDGLNNTISNLKSDKARLEAQLSDANSRFQRRDQDVERALKQLNIVSEEKEKIKDERNALTDFKTAYSLAHDAIGSIKKELPGWYQSSYQEAKNTEAIIEKLEDNWSFIVPQ